MNFVIPVTRNQNKDALKPHHIKNLHSSMLNHLSQVTYAELPGGVMKHFALFSLFTKHVSWGDILLKEREGACNKALQVFYWVQIIS